MPTIERYVSDTVGIIHYFSDVFERTSELSNSVQRIYDEAFVTYPGNVRLSIPGIVFVEIHEKWCDNEEFASRFHYEVFSRIVQSPNIEVRPIDREVLERIYELGGILENHELHDKLVVATSIVLECPLITCDSAIRAFSNDNQRNPRILF